MVSQKKQKHLITHNLSWVGSLGFAPVSTEQEAKATRLSVVYSDILFCLPWLYRVVNRV